MLRACLKAQAAEIAEKLKRRRLGAHTVQVKVRYGDFTTLSRQISVEEPLTEAAGHLPAGLFPAGPGETRFAPAAFARTGREQPARAHTGNS